MPWWLLGSSVVAGFTCARSWGRLVYQGSLGSLARALGLVGFVWGRLVNSHTPWVLLGLSGVFGFTHVGPGFIWAHPGRLGHSHAPCGSLGSSGVVLFTHARRGGRRFYPVSLWSLTRALGVVGLIRSLWVHSRGPWGLVGSSVFVRTRPSGCCVHPGSLGSLTRPGGCYVQLRTR